MKKTKHRKQYYSQIPRHFLKIADFQQRGEEEENKARPVRLAVIASPLQSKTQSVSPRPSEAQPAREREEREREKGVERQREREKMKPKLERREMRRSEFGSSVPGHGSADMQASLMTI